MRDLGFPDAKTCAILMVECETADHFIEFLRDPAVRKILLGGEEFGYIAGASACGVDAVTRIDAPTQTEHHLFVAIHEGPAITSST
ncbi:hypothetical protein B0H13DRAFT_2330901 [Mycena leptocephala]|nr:hypothetical protein B0H13DRAFT_2330901 [Mycena leptocephala]